MESIWSQWVHNACNNSFPKVIYIMGTARSGSTILEILLSHGEGVFGAGELTSIVKDGFLDDKECSCQQLTSQCSIWGEVKKNIGIDNSQLQKWVSVQKQIDWHLGFFRQLLGLNSRKKLHKYSELNQNLLVAIKQNTGCNVVLDSSKYAGRALALHWILKEDISVICLTRSPIGLMSSFQKPNKDEQRPKSRLNVLIYYVVTLISLRIACWIFGKQVFQLRYEDLLAAPNESLVRIEKWCDLDLSETKNNINENKYFDVGHIITGNRLRKNRNVFFQPRKSKEKVLDIKSRFFTSVMTGWKWILRF